MLLESAVDERSRGYSMHSGALPLGQQDSSSLTTVRPLNPARDSNPESPDVPRELTSSLRTSAST
eukprot:15365126-Ditylum_brightwellii.AAC.1